MGSVIIFMLKMTQAKIDYHLYLAVTPEMEAWGIFVTSAGRSRVAPGVDYPVGRHPEGHELVWERGRTLDSLCVVLISEGAGWLETKATGKQRVGPGMLFLLLPRMWHRYQPDPDLGWHESWIELGGAQTSWLLQHAVFDERRVLFSGAIAAGVEEQLERMHAALLHGQQSDIGATAADALRLLSLCAGLGRGATHKNHSTQALYRATRILSARHAESLNMEDVARSVGMAYSHFRRSFKQQTGYSPWQYLIQVRMARARRLLASSDATLENVAVRVGFNSAYHFSHAFKRAHSMAPGEWRRHFHPQ
jgi:AraC-like DNA-binding protein